MRRLLPGNRWAGEVTLCEAPRQRLMQALPQRGRAQLEAQVWKQPITERDPEDEGPSYPGLQVGSGPACGLWV